MAWSGRRYVQRRRSHYRSTDRARCGESAGVTELQQLIDTLYRPEWVVYVKPRFGGPEAVLKYLGRYTQRIAISNRRLVSVTPTQVSFQWKDYAHGNAKKVMTLGIEEFIRRFFLHVLPRGFVRIRYYGFLSTACREQLYRCMRMLGKQPPAKKPQRKKSWVETSIELRGIDPLLCPRCSQGRMALVHSIFPDKRGEKATAEAA